MAALDPDIVLHPLGGKDRTLSEQLKLFHLLVVVLDPYTHESSWLLETSGRILTEFAGADVRPAFVLTCDDEGAREFLGPWTQTLMAFYDPDRTFVKAMGITEVPALVHVALDCSIMGKAEGWEPETWRPIVENLAAMMHWSRPTIPAAGDPVPYEGTKV